MTSSELVPGLRIILISATFYCFEKKLNRKIALYKYARKVNTFSGRFFRNVAVIKSYPRLFFGFNEFITDLMSYFENLLIGVFESKFLLVLD